MFWIFPVAAITAYLIGSINPAIIISRGLYRMDVRGFGSHNPGFTNFKRVFGNQHAWLVFLLDFLKSAILCLLFGFLFKKFNGLFHLGAAFTGFFTMLGHSFPIWYSFQGGKGVAVMFAAIWFVDWRSALIVVAIFLVLMITTRYMSLSVLCAALSAPITLAIFGVESPAVLVIISLCVLFMIWRHKDNIKRLCKGTESKFSLNG